MTLTDKIHYRLGIMLGKRYRLWYWEKHGNAWLWGMCAAIKDDLPVTEVKDAPFTKEQLEEMMKYIHDPS